MVKRMQGGRDTMDKAGGNMSLNRRKILVCVPAFLVATSKMASGSMAASPVPFDITAEILAVQRLPLPKLAKAKEMVRRLQIVLTRYNFVSFPSNIKIFIAGSIRAINGMEIVGNGAELVQLLPQTPIFDQTGVGGFNAANMKFTGVRNDYANGASSRAVAILADNASNIVIQNCRFTHFAYGAFRGEGVQHFIWRDSVVVGPGLSASGGPLRRHISKDCVGLTVGGKGIEIDGLESSACAQGLIIAKNSDGVRLHRINIVNTVVEHGIYIDAGVKNLICDDFYISNTVLMGIKVQWSDNNNIKPENIQISNGRFSNLGGPAISFNNISENNIVRANVIEVNNIIVENSEGGGIDVRDTDNGVIEKVRITGCGNSGLYMQNCFRVKLSSCTIENNFGVGIYAGIDNRQCVIENNIVNGSGVSMDPKEFLRSALFVGGGTQWNISGNKLTTQHGNALYWAETADKRTSLLTNNMFQGRGNGVRIDGSDRNFANFGRNSSNGRAYSIESIK